MDKNSKSLVIAILATAFVSVSGAFLYTKLADNGSGVAKGDILSAQQAAEKAITYINDNLLTGGVMASLMNVIEEGGVYKMHMKIVDNEFDSYITKDGRYLFPDALDLNASIENTAEEGTLEDITKREKPDIKIFVMSYCPYGLQAQKMFLPVYNLLKEKADIGVYFVDYIMHEKKEIDENLRQYCIQKEQPDKYYSYLSCFVEKGDFDGCLKNANIENANLSNCINSTDKEYSVYDNYADKNTWLNGTYPTFDVQKELNEKYGIGGSPTIVINDKVIQLSSRSPEVFKQAVCQAFESEPQECSQILSDAPFTPGFGLEEGASSGGACE